MKKLLALIWKYMIAVGEARYEFVKRTGFKTGY